MGGEHNVSGVAGEATGNKCDASTRPHDACALARGYVIPPHLHEVEIETFYIISGQGVLHLGDHDIAVGRGQGGSVPVGVEHSLRNAGDTEIELLAIHVRVDDSQ